MTEAPFSRSSLATWRASQRESPRACEPIAASGGSTCTTRTRLNRSPCVFSGINRLMADLNRSNSVGVLADARSERPGA